MTVFLEIPALLLVMDNRNLGSAADLCDGAFDGSLGNERGADGGVLAIVDKEDLVEDHRVALFVGIGKLLNGDNIAL